MIKVMILAAAALTMGTAADAQTMIQKNDIKVENHLMTPEALWAMGRIGGAEASPNGKQVVYQVGYYSVKGEQGSSDALHHGCQRQEPEGIDHRCKERNRCCLDSGRTEDCLHPRRTALEHEP